MMSQSYFGIQQSNTYFDDPGLRSLFLDEEHTAPTDDHEMSSSFATEDPDGITFQDAFGALRDMVTQASSALARRSDAQSRVRPDETSIDRKVPTDIEQRISAAQVLFDSRRYHEVIETLSDCRGRDPRLPFLRGASHFHLDENVTAHEHLSFAIELSPYDPLYLYYFGVTCIALEKNFEALYGLQRAQAYSKRDSDVYRLASAKADDVQRASRFRSLVRGTPRLHNYATQILCSTGCAALGIYIYSISGSVALMSLALLVGLGFAVYVAYEKITNIYDFKFRFLEYSYGLITDTKMMLNYGTCKYPQLKRRTLMDWLLGNYWLYTELTEGRYKLKGLQRRKPQKTIWIPSLGDKAFMYALHDFLAVSSTNAKFIVESQTDRQK